MARCKLQGFNARCFVDSSILSLTIIGVKTERGTRPPIYILIGKSQIFNVLHHYHYHHKRRFFYTPLRVEEVRPELCNLRP